MKTKHIPSTHNSISFVKKKQNYKFIYNHLLFILYRLDTLCWRSKIFKFEDVKKMGTVQGGEYFSVTTANVNSQKMEVIK